MKIINSAETVVTATSHAPVTAIAKKVFLKKGEIPHLTQFASGIFKSGSYVELHSHKDMYEIFMITQGSIDFVVNGENRTLSTGMGIVVEPGDEHEVRNHYGQDAHLLFFSIVK